LVLSLDCAKAVGASCARAGAVDVLEDGVGVLGSEVIIGRDVAVDNSVGVRRSERIVARDVAGVIAHVDGVGLLGVAVCCSVSQYVAGLGSEMMMGAKSTKPRRGAHLHAATWMCSCTCASESDVVT